MQYEDTQKHLVMKDRRYDGLATPDFATPVDLLMHSDKHRNSDCHRGHERLGAELLFP